MRSMIRLATALALVIAACGGGTTESTSPEDGTTANQQEGSITPSPGVVGSGLCAGAAQVLAVFAGGGDLEDAVTALEKMAEEAPDELRADFELLAQAYQAHLEGDFDRLSEDDVNAAGDRIDAFLASECGLTDPDDEELDEGTGASNTYEMTATGALEFQHTGEASCWLVSGGFGIEFYSDQDFDIAYDAAVEAERAEPGIYHGDFGFYTPDEEEAFGPATITIQEVNDLGNDAVEVVGTIEAGYDGDELGSGDVSGSFRCLITAEEAAGEY